MSEDRERLAQLATAISGQLQEMQGILGRNPAPDAARVRFPRGFIRTAAEIRDSLPKSVSFLNRKNISYALMVLDVFRWLIVRTDLDSVARGMIVKEGICILGSTIETMIRSTLSGHISKGAKFSACAQALQDKETIDQTLRDEIDWIWGIRANQHYHLLEESEQDKYTPSDYNRALLAFNQLREKIISDFG